MFRGRVNERRFNQIKVRYVSIVAFVRSISYNWYKGNCHVNYCAVGGVSDTNRGRTCLRRGAIRVQYVIMHFVEQVGVIQKFVGLRWLCGKCYWASRCAMGAEVDAISTENCFQKMDKLCNIQRDSRQVCRANHPMPRFSVRKGKKLKEDFAQFLSWLRRQSWLRRHQTAAWWCHCSHSE